MSGGGGRTDGDIRVDECNGAPIVHVKGVPHRVRNGNHFEV